MEVASWRWSHGGGLMEVVSWRWSHGGGLMEVVSWRWSHGGGLMEVVSWRWSHDGHQSAPVHSAASRHAGRGRPRRLLLPPPGPRARSLLRARSGPGPLCGWYGATKRRFGRLLSRPMTIQSNIGHSRHFAGGAAQLLDYWGRNLALTTPTPDGHSALHPRVRSHQRRHLSEEQHRRDVEIVLVQPRGYDLHWLG